MSEKQDAATQILEKLNGFQESLDGLNDRIEKTEGELKKAAEPKDLYGVKGKAPGARTGEDIMTSRPYSLMRVAKVLASKNKDWDGAKVEADLSERLGKFYGESSSSFRVPFASDLMAYEDEEGNQYGEPVDTRLVKECRDIMSVSHGEYDPDEFQEIAKQVGLRKDLSTNNALIGGTLRALAAEGELIELLRAQEVFSRVGARQIALPVQGSIRMPRTTSSLTVESTSEGALISESTPGTGALVLSAKTYAALVDIPEEMFKFTTAASVEQWLRTEITRDFALKLDRDQMDGLGGEGIKGLLNYAILSLAAGTAGANGDTLEVADPIRLWANIADSNAPVDQSFFYAMTNLLWASLSTRRADAVSAADNAGVFLQQIASGYVGGGMPQKMLNGQQVICSSQVPRNRTKGAGTDLTVLVGGVGPEWIQARSGVLEFDMTNADQDKFNRRISTLRATQYMDAGPRHLESFGYIDTLLNA